MEPEPLPTTLDLFLRAPLYAVYSLTEVCDSIRAEEVRAEGVRKAGEIINAFRAQSGGAVLGSSVPPANPKESEEWRETQRLERIRGFDRPLDAHCVGCGAMATFVPPRPQQPNERAFGLDSYDDNYFVKFFECSRKPSHHLWFVFHADSVEWTVTKVGQNPSLADLAAGNIERYRRVKALDKDDLREFTKAVRLESHGVGAGALVYLRRIVERFLERAHVAASKESGWDEDAYTKERVLERIKHLQDRLPPSLVRNSVAYSILSRAIHELSEEECLAHFPAVRAALEEVFEELLALQLKAERELETKRALDLAATKIKAAKAGG